MIIAIDESGDNGKKLWRGSSRWFILGAAIADESDTCGVVCKSVKQFISDYDMATELHFSQNTPETHEAFLQYMSSQDYLFACYAIDKRKLLAKRPWVLRSKLQLYNYALGALFSNIKMGMDSPTVIIDRNGPPWLTKSVNKYVLSNFGTRHKGDMHAIKDMYADDSAHQPMLQLADYVAGATRHYIENYTDAYLYEKYLANKGKIFYD